LIKRYFSVQIGQNSTNPIHTIKLFSLQSTNSQNVPALTIHFPLEDTNKNNHNRPPIQSIQIQRPVTSQPLTVRIPPIPATTNRQKQKKWK